MFDAESLRKDFPMFREREIVYLDNAATTQKPQRVIDAVSDYYRNSYSNVHRGVYRLSEEATGLYENARENISGFVNAGTENSLIFVRNTTEALNLLSYSLGHDLKSGDEVLLTQMEHHSNIVPWQFLSEKGVRIRYAKITADGTLDMDDFANKINKNTKIISVCHVSNVLGTINPVREICSMARERDILSVVDGAQSVPHMPVDIHEIDSDFYAFSGHKMLGPSGIGCLIGKNEVLEKMHPFMGGGEMISSVSFDSSEYAPVPLKFEAGTPNVEGAVGLSAAVEYLKALGMDQVREHEKEIISHVLRVQDQENIVNLVSFGPKNPEIRGGVYTFNLGNVPWFDLNDALKRRDINVGASIHPHDLAAELDTENIAIRSGHHCAMPLMSVLNQSATARASFYVYNDIKEADMLMSALKKMAEELK